MIVLDREYRVSVSVLTDIAQLKALESQKMQALCVMNERNQYQTALDRVMTERINREIDKSILRDLGIDPDA